ncbi:MFS transporter [Euzebya sp.]|uniref:MFS transporter n=1 Tax=Euzebya sp. TaxID=1971409 RepID=UPI0035165CF8
MAEPTGRWVLLATVLGSSIAMITGTVVNVALPALADDLGAGVAERQWVVTSYLLTLSALILLGGSLGDRYGRRRVFLVGVGWFAVTSLLCAVAPTLPLLIAARTCQGIGAALLTPGSLAIIQSTFAPEDRARAIGAWSALGSIGAALGPLLGGVLIDWLSWRWVFLITVPLAVVVVVVGVRHVPESRDRTITGSPDVLGALTSVVGLAGLTFAVIEAPGRGVGDPLVQAAALVGLVASAAFVVVERRVRSPMLPASIFASRQFTYANVLCLIVYAALGGVFFLLVQHLQIVLGWSATAAGAAALPVTVLMLVLSERAGAWAQRSGPRVPLTVGPVAIGAGMALMATIGADDGYLTAVLPAVVVFGLGLSATVAPVTATVLAAADERLSGIASGVNNAVSRVAQLLAVALLPVLAGLSGTAGGQVGAATFAAGFSRAMLMAAALAGAGAVLAWVTIRDDVLEAGGGPVEDAGADGPAAPGDAAPGDAAARWHCAVESAPLTPRRGDCADG